MRAYLPRTLRVARWRPCRLRKRHLDLGVAQAVQAVRACVVAAGVFVAAAWSCRGRCAATTSAPACAALLATHAASAAPVRHLQLLPACRLFVGAAKPTIADTCYTDNIYCTLVRSASNATRNGNDSMIWAKHAKQAGEESSCKESWLKKTVTRIEGKSRFWVPWCHKRYAPPLHT